MDTPGVLMTEATAAGASTPITADLYPLLWTVRTTAEHEDGFGWKFPSALPKPSLDTAGNPLVRVTLGKGGLSFDFVIVENTEEVLGSPTLRSLAVVTPSGGYGGLSPYLTNGMIYSVFFGTLLPDADDLALLTSLGLSNKDTSRAGHDSTYDANGFRFHFIGTPDHGEWLIATATP